MISKHAYTPRPRDGYVEPKKKQGSTPSDALPQKRKIGTVESSASGAGGATSGPKKSIPFPHATTEYLTAWMNQHANNPFPDSNQKAKMITDTGLSKRQLSDWMARYVCESFVCLATQLPDTNRYIQVSEEDEAEV